MPEMVEPATSNPTFAVHKMIVPVDPEEGIQIIHTFDCDLLPDEGGAWYPQWNCAVDFEITNCGLNYYFEHVANKGEAMGWCDPEYLEPGEYKIQYWFETYYHHEYGPEYNAGLALVDET